MQYVEFEFIANERITDPGEIHRNMSWIPLVVEHAGSLRKRWDVEADDRRRHGGSDK